LIFIYTIGFSKKNLKEFIARLKNAGVKKVIDVRLNNTSQLAGYAKKEDLEYVLGLVGIDYEHHPELAPTEDLLKSYKKKQITWQEYEKIYRSPVPKPPSTYLEKSSRCSISTCGSAQVCFAVSTSSRM